MFYQKFSFFILILLSFSENSAGQTTYCTPQDIQPVVDPSSLPVLPTEFQTRAQATFQSQRTVDFLIKYDYYDQKAEIITQEDYEHDRRVFYYDKNEYFTITNYSQCVVKKINESTDEFNLFGLVIDPDGFFNMKPVNEFFHLNDKYPYQYVSREIIRGIPTDHYISCQNWDEFQANFLIHFYFSVPEFQQSVQYPDQSTRVPVSIRIQGYLGSKNGKMEELNNQYDFYEFRPLVEKKQDLFVQPEGIFCKDQTFKDTMPTIPKTFSFVEEVIIDDLNLGKTTTINYNYDLKIIRFDYVTDSTYRDNTPVKVIHDYNSGVGYIIDKNAGNCSSFPLGDEPDSISLGSTSGNGVVLRDPNQFFHIDDSYYYVGQRLERGIACDVFASNRTDFRSPHLLQQPKYWVFEIYFMAIGQVEENDDGEIGMPPVAIRITASEGKGKYLINIYDFDPVPASIKTFDVSSCFLGKQKTEFAISFKYPQEIDVDSFVSNFERLIETGFYKPMLSVLSSFNLSPFRIIPPTIKANKRGFEIYSGLTNYAPPINHFRRTLQVKLNLNNAPFKKEASSPENCALLCLNDSVLNSNFYKCLSFDLCLNPSASPSSASFICSFYNSSFITDPSLILDSEPECDHYSKNVASVDSVMKEDAYRAVEASVLRNEFIIDFEIEETTLVFQALDIYPATLDPNSDSANGISIGSSNFFKQFTLVGETLDFKIEGVSNDPLIQLRQRKGLSIDECARLCMIEQAFKCESLTYEPIVRECKWSSLINEILFGDKFKYIEIKEGYSLFLRDPLYNYDLLPFKVSSDTDLKEVRVNSPSDCAYNCNYEKNFKCRSFNLCEYPNPNEYKYKCLLSDKHNHDTNKDPNLTYSPICQHYTRKNIDDFKLVPNMQLNVSPQAKYFNISAEICATLCSYLESFVCRSFDFFIDTNTCFLYKQNIKDNIHINIELIKNDLSNHYSREYFNENGIDVEIEYIKDLEKADKYGGGAIFGVILGFLVVGLIIGAASIFAYMKIKQRGKPLPPISFSNPNSKF